MKRTDESGFSLIELIVFMLIMSTLIGGFVSIFSNSLAKSAVTNEDTQALLLAQQRMEIILRQRRDLGFSGFSATSFDPCTRTTPSTLPVCTGTPSGFVVASNLVDNWTGNLNYKQITVTVTGNGYASLTTLVANY